MIVTGYKFLTIEDFNTSNELCNAYYGIRDETTVLGVPTDFEVRDFTDMLN